MKLRVYGTVDLILAAGLYIVAAIIVVIIIVAACYPTVASVLMDKDWLANECKAKLGLSDYQIIGVPIGVNPVKDRPLVSWQSTVDDGSTSKVIAYDIYGGCSLASTK